MTDFDPTAFTDFALDPRLLAAIETLGFTATTPIQTAAIPPLLEGRDVIGRARTGSGKTAAFALPVLERAKDGGKPPRGLILAPTRELAIQVAHAIADLAAKLPKVSVATIYGGAPYPPQIRALKSAAVIVGTPGRTLDHLKRGTLDLTGIETFVLDEADEMLRMGFIEDVRQILDATPSNRQVALFSATMPPPIRKIADAHLNDPVIVQVERHALTVEHITQQWMRVPQRHKSEALFRVLGGIERGSTLVFSRTRAGCAEVADALARAGVPADALHGDLNQAARERVLSRLRAKRLDVLVATDVAARGIDVEHITHVINLDLPRDTETYVHRIGRTGRVGRAGTAITFVTPKEKRHIRSLEKALRVSIRATDIPTDADIARQQRSRLLTLVQGSLDSQDIEYARQWTQEVVSNGNLSLEDLAAGALLRLVHIAGGSLSHIPDETAPSWARSAEAFGRAPPAKAEKCNEVQLFFSVGRQHGVRPADLVGALTNEAQVDGTHIGRIEVYDYKTFVGMPRAVAEHVLQTLPRVSIRGRSVAIAPAHATPRETDSTHPKRSSKKKSGPRHSAKGYRGNRSFRGSRRR